MFCSNCGSPLAEGAKFCSECGAKVEEIKVRDLGIFDIDEPTNVTDDLAGKPLDAEEAFDARLSFDWSDLKDEPQRKEIPQGIKSPWAHTTGSIEERDILSEMTPSDSKDRTMQYLDMLRADKEERDRAALDRSIEYTEVLEYDPELVGGTKPPKLRMAPLYEDVDAPVKTPFDDMETSESEEEYIPTIEQHADDNAFTQEVKTEAETAPKFELPDFLKKAEGFGVGKDEVVEIKREEEVELPVEEPIFEEPVAEEPEVEEPPAEEPAAEEPVVEETFIEKHAAPEPVVEETSTEFTEEAYLDEDLYLELSEPPRTERISRIDAHASEYEEIDDEADEPVDEDELFTEMTESEHKKTGMTIASPADDETELEELKKKFEGLTGTVEIDPSLLEEAEVEETVEPEVAPVEEPAEEGPFEALGADFTFEPEITPADDAMFEGLTPASEPAAQVVEPTEEIKYDDFMFEPEVTPEDDAMFAGLTPASEPEEPAPELVAEAPVVEPIEEPVVEAPVVEPIAEPEVEAPVIEPIAEPEIEAPIVEPIAEPEVETPVIEPIAEPEVEAPVIEPIAEPEVEAPIVEPIAEPVVEAPIVEPIAEPVVEAPVVEPVEEVKETPAAISPEDTLYAAFIPKETQDDSPIVGYAPAVTEISEETVTAGPAVISLDEFASEVETPAVEPATAPVVEPAAEEVKATDAVSLEELDLFGKATGEEAEAESTKKIDKFYTLYRKNEEFQRLLDEEYSRLKGENIDIPEEEPSLGLGAAAGESKTAASPAGNGAAVGLAGAEPILEEIAADTKPVEDATIYQMNMPEDLAEIAKKSENNSGFRVEGVEDKNVGMGEVAGTVAAGAAAGAALTKAEKKAAKKAEKKAKKEARKEAAQITDPQVEYENVDGGSTILTILAVIVALLLVVLLAIILVLHIAPSSELALSIDEFIEGITSRFSAINTFGGRWLL